MGIAEKNQSLRSDRYNFEDEYEHDDEDELKPQSSSLQELNQRQNL